ncbi:GNAT family N-acetyltransferase [Paenibacillus sp. FSL R7-0333]|uniref:GNAT family N-acetyltransferase n=1 Tax=Paenibacillus sp. FSL R7-0333 TaxID=1926587 RepID=UPI00096ED9AC|nr:GNAT family N-acetyltransferase [Paenibacillus sp. FSL R7-0333]
MNSLITVRLASITDAEALSGLNQEFNGGVHRSPARIIEHLHTNRNELIAVAELNGSIIGFGCAQSLYSFCYEEPYGEITELYVQDTARRKGAARAIITCLEDELRLRGVKRVKVLTGRRNTAAIRTYEDCGYVKDDEQMLDKELTNEARPSIP